MITESSQLPHVSSRYGVALLAATSVTFALLYMMQLAIQTDGPIEKPHALGPTVDWLPLLKEELPEPVDRRPKPPEPVVPQPPMPTMTAVTADFAVAVTTVIPQKLPQTTPRSLGADGGPLPLMTVQPEYPERAARQGIEGWVEVEFSIDASGKVTAARVLRAEPSNIFDRAALKAVQRYKYKPMVVNGASQPVHGVRQRLVFQLGGAA